MELKQYNFYWASLGQTQGHEIQDTRPIIIISPKSLNKYLQTVIVAPLTKTKRQFSFRPCVTINNKKSYICLDQIKALDKKRLTNHIDQASSKIIKQLKQIIKELFIT